jgi:hypothetical protein
MAPDSVACRAGSVRVVRSRSRRLFRVFGLFAIVALFATGCRVQLETKVAVGFDGSGMVTQGIGFDDAALRRVGDPLAALRADDLRDAGWKIDAANREGDLTWVRVHHSFSTPEEGTALLAQLSGPDGPYRAMKISRDDGFLSTSVGVTGQIDTTAGLAMFGDAQLTSVLGDDPSGGMLAKIEAEEKAPPASMVGLELVVDAGSTSRTYDASFTDTSVQDVKVSDSKGKLLSILETMAVALLVVASALVLGLRWRARRTRTRRLMRSSTRRW